MSCILVIDAGTTNVRVSLLDEGWQVLGTASDPSGVRFTAIDGHNGRLKAALKQCISNVLLQCGISREQISACYAYGMITSAGGLLEIPHLTAPADVHAFHAGLVTHAFPELAPFPITFIPGLRSSREQASLTNLDALDMMRGEETEALGLWSLLRPERDMLLVLPGSHNKIIALSAGGTICGSMTSVSGELLDAMTSHTILAESVDHGFADEEHYSRELVLAGSRACAGGFGHAAFETRLMHTLGSYSVWDARNFLLGAVLRLDVEAVRHFTFFSPEQVLMVAGKPPVSQALTDLFTSEGWHAQPVAQELRKSMGIAGVKVITEA